MRLFLRIATGIVPVALSGCGMMINVPTNPDNYSIDAKAVAHLRAPQSVALENAYPEELPATMPIQHNTLVVEQQKLTQTAIVMLRRALEKQGIAVSAQGDKTITVRVRAQGYRMQAFRWTGQVILEAKLGDGTIISYPNESLSPKGWENAFDGAVLFALNDLVGDERFVAYMNSARVDPPKPAASTPALPAPAVPAAVASAVSGVGSASAANPRFPQVGDSWTYRLKSRQRGAGLATTHTVTVMYSSEARIIDQVRRGASPPAETTHGRGSYLVTEQVSILSPYITVFEDLRVGASLGDIVTKEDLGCRGRDRCEVSGKVVGKELVRVPAGDFEAVKVTVDQRWHNPSGSQFLQVPQRELNGWYVPAVKRFVKFTSRPVNGNTPDFDLELMSYQVK